MLSDAILATNEIGRDINNNGQDGGIKAVSQQQMQGVEYTHRLIGNTDIRSLCRCAHHITKI